MAVRAQQYPTTSHHPLNRAPQHQRQHQHQHQQREDMDYTSHSRQPPALFLSNAKRPRETPPTALHLGETHNPLAAQLLHHQREMDCFVAAQAEQLRRALAERRRAQWQALTEAAARRLGEKEAEVAAGARRTAELEERLSRLRAESVGWQAKAMADQAAACALQAQLQQAAAARLDDRGPESSSSAAEDAGSACVDPGRVERERACRACWARPASVVLLPCRHLCLCSGCCCDGEACPVCGCARTGGVQVLFS